MTRPPQPAPPPGATQRTVALAMLGSALALGACAVLTYTGMVAMDDAVRPWVAAGVGIAAVLDIAMAIYFLRKSQS